MGWTAVKQRARSAVPPPGRENPGDRGGEAQTRMSVPTRTVARVPRAAGRNAGISVAAARGIAERAHQRHSTRTAGRTSLMSVASPSC